MLGRLFHAASSTAPSPTGTRPSTSYASETDELQTRLLLYPDSSSSVNSSFHSSTTSGSFSAQSILSSATSCSSTENLDLDPGRDVRVIIAQDGSAQDLKTVIYDSRPNFMNQAYSSAEEVYQPTPPPPPPSLGGPYGRNRRRAPVPPPGAGNDEIRVFTDCMFGAGTLAYKGPSTKVHILPTVEEHKPSPPPPAPALTSSRRGSLRLGRAKEPSPIPQPARTPTPTVKRKSVLITRLFSIALPATTIVSYEGARNIPNAPAAAAVGLSNVSGDRTPTPMSSVGSNNGFPFPKTASPKVAKPPRTSMYAVGIIISVPAMPAGNSNSATMSFACPTPPNYDDDFPPLLPSCLNRRDSYDDAAASSGCMDIISKHWDVITRALSDLQHVAQARILATLTTQAAMASPAIPPQNGSYSARNYRRLELHRMALIKDDAVKAEVERLRWRVAQGIKIPRVVVGQGRWDIWQEEAKWASQRYCGRNKNFFFLTLLTAFLGNHTAWLDVMAPESYKRRHLHNLSYAATNPEYAAIPTRTVLLCNDKIAARKLVYLLSAFLPAQPHQTLDVPPPPPPAPTSTTGSINYLSQSPPTFSSSPPTRYSKIGSIRTKTAKKKPSKLNMVSGSLDDGDTISGWDIPRAPGSGTSSAAASAIALPLPALPTTVTPESGLTPASSPRKPSSTTTRPESRDSNASQVLMTTLRRNGSVNHGHSHHIPSQPTTSLDSQDSSKWGSFFSMWSASATTLKSTQSSLTSCSSSSPSPPTLSTSNSTSLDDCITPNHKHSHPSPHIPPQPADIKCSIDEHDGTINVDIPLGPSFLPSYLTSPLSSPPQHQSFLNTTFPVPTKQPSLPDPSSSSILATETDVGSAVAGWIEEHERAFHPDFVLQAVKPYSELVDEVKRAMRREPIPWVHSSPFTEIPTPVEDEEERKEEWGCVAESLIVDTTTLGIRKLRLLRKVGGEEDEKWEDEQVVDVDDVLGSAVEQVVGVVGGTGEKGRESVSKVVLGALEKIVGSVCAGEVGDEGNCLVEGIRRWGRGESAGGGAWGRTW